MPRLPAFLVLAALSLAPLACRSTPLEPWAAPPSGIETHWTDARLGLRADTPRAREVARGKLERIVAEAPRWTPALRALDDLARTEGDLVGAWTKRLASLAADPDDVVALYLTGRLEGEAGGHRFERAIALDPNYAWGHHGWAWFLFQQGRRRQAVAAEERALRLAATPTERALFTDSLARFLLVRKDWEASLEQLATTLEEAELDQVDRLALTVALTENELIAEALPLKRRGLDRALQLVRRADLTELELRRLVAGVRLAALEVDVRLPFDGILEVALAERPGLARGRVLADLLNGGSADVLAAGIVTELGDAIAVDELVLAKILRGDARGALDTWVAAQPQATLAGGMPVRPELAELVAASRVIPFDAIRFGRALFDAGWFAEARAWTTPLSFHSVEAARALRARAVAEEVTLERLRALLAAVDEGRPHGGPWTDGSYRGRKVDDLDELLDAVQALLGQAGSTGVDVRHSPREDHGPFASVVLPGPVFTARDEQRGLGEEGAPVPGLASAMAARGRFAVFGQALGTGGPDGAILRLVALEQRAGSHLGVPFTGLCAWCDGQDVPSRPERLGAMIGGAALHEGWWVDLGIARDTLRSWRTLVELLEGPGGQRVATSLSGSGPPRASLSATELIATGGLGDRLRLTVLAERLARAPDAAPITLDEILAVTTTHEEGHLCDRTRFLPLSKHWGAILRLFLQAGGQPSRVAELLEYRAQLTALAECVDPRLPLAQCLDRLERPSSRTPHDAGYRKLVEELLDVLADRVEEYGLDPERFLVHQLHRLPPTALRELARIVAAREGMLRTEE